MKYHQKKVTLSSLQLRDLNRGIIGRTSAVITLSAEQVHEMLTSSNGTHELPLTSLQLEILDSAMGLNDVCKLSFHPLQLKEIASKIFNQTVEIDLIAFTKK